MRADYIRNKGKAFERLIAHELSRTLKVSFRRTPCSGALHHAWEGDIMKMDSKPTIIDNTVIECKDCKTIKMLEWIRQVEEESKRADTKKWLLFFKVNGRARVCLNADQLQALLKKAQNGLQ